MTWKLINDIYDKAEIAHKFNNFLTNIGPNLANTINSNTDKSHPFYMNSKTLINFEFTDVDENTVIDILGQLPLKSSFGFNEWLKVNKLSLNVNKSKYMLFNAGNKIQYIPL